MGQTRGEAGCLKIIWASDDPFWTTGFGCESFQILSRLAKVKPKWQLAAQHRGFQGLPFKTNYGFGLVPHFGAPGNQDEEYRSVEHYLENYPPDFFITLWDIWYSKFMAPYSQKARPYSRTKWVSWFVYDVRAETSPEYYKDVLRHCDCPIATSQYTQKAMLSRYGLRIGYIPHGVDPKEFHPLPRNMREERREKYGNPDVMVGAFFRNTARKNPVHLLKAWQTIHKEYPDATLFFNMKLNDPDLYGSDLKLYSQEFQIQKSIILSRQHTAENGVPIQQMNAYYNDCDFQVLPTSGEGFGKPIIEGYAANGLPVIMTDCTTYPELVGSRGLPIRVESWVWTHAYGQFAIPSVRSLTEQMRILIDDRKLRRKFREANQKFVLAYDYDRVIVPAWIQLLEGLKQ